VKKLFFGVLLCTVAFGQTNTLTFESSDVHVSAPATNPTMRGGALRGGRYEVRTATMVDLISVAYNMESNKVLGGPSWLDWDRFDLVAKAPPTAKQSDVGPMLQTLLADRFKLVVRKDTKPMPAYALSVGTGKHKMKEATADQPGCQPVPQNPPPGTIPYQVLSCHGITMETFANVLRDWNGGTYIADPVVDRTGLSGTFDFDIKWTPRNRLAQAGSDGITIFDAVDKQLGLKLEPQKLPLPVLVVDSVNETPTPNAADVSAKIPPRPPTEFEVATIKPSPPDARGQNGRIQNGRVDVQNFTVKQLIQIAWELPNNNDDFIVGLPKSAAETRYTIAAKVASSGTVNSEDIDFDSLLVMLRGLIVERFGLKAHMEDRPVAAYTMTASKQTKLQKADPQNRTNCKSGAGTNPMLNRLITCQNMNLTQFAVMLQNMANGYVRAPIKDATGLEGNWDLSVSFSGVGLLPGAAFDPNGPERSDPNGSLTLPEALQKQLGLKLELEKRPLPVLVIDHIEDKPTEN
jgi:uncharacterized protein (TIGR03435 family)